FFISDSTGITAETLGAALLSQFPKIKIAKITIPYINSVTRAHEVVEQINCASRADQTRPLVFSTLAKPKIRNVVEDCDGLVIDFFSASLRSLENELQSTSAKQIGTLHQIPDFKSYDARIAAIDFTLQVDDGLGVKDYKSADVILLGVSRSGKTPTSLYLALKFGILAANYPLIPEDINSTTLPEALKPHRKKLFGLLISPKRLHEIRQKRQPNTKYASLEQCKTELIIVEKMFKQEKIGYLDSTAYSIEEIATKIINAMELKRHK
ncbi:MAG: kinase/pyrophosphorylase, partial [Gammaproteobacteria bacterium]|nr:kinase/pyrophosphorylase [Gammaproteobacteria bacterium]